MTFFRTVKAFDDVEAELKRALEKFPSFNSGHEGWAVIKEELDELFERVRLKQSTPDRDQLMYGEAMQVAAMAIRFMIEIPEFRN